MEIKYKKRRGKNTNRFSLFIPIYMWGNFIENIFHLFHSHSRKMAIFGCRLHLELNWNAENVKSVVDRQRRWSVSSVALQMKMSSKSHNESNEETDDITRWIVCVNCERKRQQKSERECDRKAKNVACNACPIRIENEAIERLDTDDDIEKMPKMATCNRIRKCGKSILLVHDVELLIRLSFSSSSSYFP